MAIKGFSLQQKTGLKEQYVTVNPAGKDKFGIDVLHKNFYPIDVEKTITGYNPQTGDLTVASHGARAGDSIRFIGGTNNRAEIPILEVIDTNTLRVYKSSVSTIALNIDELLIMRPISPTADEDGNLVVAVTAPPTQIYVNGVATSISKNTSVPNLTVPMPVEIVGADGVEINITAGDINVQLSDQGVNYDITRIGDGTNQISINASSELLVHDQNLEDVVATDGAAIPSKAIAVGGTDGTNLQTISVDTDGKVNVIASGTVAVSSVAGSVSVTGPLTDAQLRATAPSVKISDGTETVDIVPLGTAVVNADNGIVTQSVIHGLTTAGGGAYVDVKVDPSGALTVAVDQLPTTVGIKADAASLSVTQSTEDRVISNSMLTSLQLIDDSVNTDGSAVTTKGLMVGGTDGTNFQQLSVTSAGILNVSGTFSAGAPAAVTVKSAQVTVGTSAVRITTDGSAPSSTRQMVSFRPITTGSARFFWGPSGVTTSTGAEVYSGESILLENNINDYYIISDTAAQKVHVVEAE